MARERTHKGNTISYQTVNIAALDIVEDITVYHSEQLKVLREFIGLHAATEQNFGPATALPRYGKDCLPGLRNTEWLKLGAKGSCYNNATGYALIRDDVWYTEGNALDPELLIPLQHAWRVDAWTSD